MTELADLCLLVVDCEHKTAPKSEDGYPLVRTTDIGRGRLDLSNVQRVDAGAYEQWTRRAVPQPGDLILAREAPVGNVAIVTPGLEPVLGQRTVLIRPDPGKVDPDYLTYRLLADDIQHWMNGVANGSTVPHLNMEDIRALPVTELPALEDQRRVGAAIAAFDDLVENNRRRIGVLEEMARLIYREWFVHFRFPGHEDVELVDSDLGLIPEGWAAQELGDHAEVVKGLSYKGAHLSDEGLPMATLKCFAPNGGFRRDGVKGYDGPFKDRHSVAGGDIVVANTDLTPAGNIVGRAARLPSSVFEAGGLLTHHLFRVRVRDESDVSPTYLLAALSDPRFREFARAHASGTTVLGFRRDDALRYSLLRPSPNVMGAFDAMVGPMLTLSEILERESEVLAAARDLLLPRLVSGELDVSDLEPVG